MKILKRTSAIVAALYASGYQITKCSGFLFSSISEERGIMQRTKSTFQTPFHLGCLTLRDHTNVRMKVKPLSSLSDASSFPDENNNNNNSNNEGQRSNENKDLLVKDTVLATVHVISCLGLAVLFCIWENYDCSNLKPLSSTLRPMAIKGMGYGQNDRMEDWRGQQVLSGIKGDDITLSKIPSYNEIMERHRLERVPMWTAAKVTPNNNDVGTLKIIGVADIQKATQDIYNSLEAVESLKIMADDYQWDEMRSLIRQPVLSSKIEEACSVLRGAVGFISLEGRQEIGFDWGSCAWRHCGAEADTQEALAEFYNLLGVLEPFECRFVLDIVERSLRDILIVIPPKYHQERTIQPYIPYEPVGQANGEMWIDENGDSQESNNMGVDVEFLNALKFLRSNSDDE
mmetsp:Transcript_5070/g.7699  ORF Transcript_5070/g.7699 Transcript_5070/m.7699 type:complete len:401 (+) Transcript_5070:182-1384(+)|eukprot:CAMPEP_0195294718 /NCGR_PEP_ID=MMETSP0707-20130614/15755_1 /TAXON_ID=33640 /ORGANISM="Asterionellopsis glacialis, Strain CCMP134" /LENGTH=400 /DNA_ID=CAMNT_0040355763 /DNA_START=76 /DNA_END=1278 /DNA_ORIENTATION=-